MRSPQPDAAPAESALTDEALASGAYRVLCVEDDAINRKVLQMQFALLGCAVTLVGRAESALELIAAHDYDLVCIDLGLPDIDGLALASQIRSMLREPRRLPVLVAITGQTRRQEGFREAIDDFAEVLSKPAGIERLEALLNTYLGPLAFGAPRVDASSAIAPHGGSPDDERTEGALTELPARRTWPELFGTDDQHVVRGLLQAMSAHVAKISQALKAASAGGQMERCCDLAHQLRGAALVTGCQALAGAAKRYSVAIAMATDAQARMRVWDTLNVQIEAVLNSIRRMPTPDAAGPLAGMSASDSAVVPQLAEASAWRGRIALWDHDPVSSAQLCLLLSRLGHEPQLLGDLTTLPAFAAASGSADLLLLHVRFPGALGLDLIRSLSDAGYRGHLLIYSAAEPGLLRAIGDIARLRQLRLVSVRAKPLLFSCLQSSIQAIQRVEIETRTVSARRSLAVSTKSIRAVLRDDHVQVHLQPQFATDDLRLVGVEALARVGKPDRQLGDPSEWIDAAERYGLIKELSTRLCQQAMRATQILFARHPGLGLSLNIAASWMQSEPELDRFLRDMAEMHGIAPQQITLELTETGLPRDPLVSAETLTRLRMSGFRLALDDFGVGYSTLQLLQRLPFDEIKLDRGFVTGAASDPQARAILSAIVELAQTLGMVTVAEGVETEADLACVRALGCESFQGWWMARAMPVEALLAWIDGRMTHDDTVNPLVAPVT